MSINRKISLEMEDNGNAFQFSAKIDDELLKTESILTSFVESEKSIKSLKSKCDKVDYLLAVSSGVLCGILDIFLVGRPGKSSIGNQTDKWFEERTKDFAKMCGWNPNETRSKDSAIRFLERRFNVPYDQRGAGDIGSSIFDLTPRNHHFKSLAHNPSLIGLFYSILDQFTNTSHFVSEGELISLQNADDKFELIGSNTSTRIFCGVINWIGHLVSDISGSSGSQGRGMGIPSPLWVWTNDVIAIKRELNIPVGDFDKSFSELAKTVYLRGYDMRFQTSQMIPVFLNETIVRVLYSTRRLIKYYGTINKNDRSFKVMWRMCEPFTNSSIKRMLTVAHGTFCLIDIGDALARSSTSGGLVTVDFFLRLNIVGVGRFATSLYGEMKIISNTSRNELTIDYIKREKLIVQDYLDSLKILSKEYDDSKLLGFVEDFESSEMYVEGFKKSILLASKRKVPDSKIIKSKLDIDNYFKGDNNGKDE